MKKLFLFIVVLFLGNAYAQNGQVMHEIVMKHGLNPSFTRPIKPRSVKPVEAYINYDFEEIEVNFNDDLEKVVVVIQDQTGQEFCSYCCDTNSEPVVSLPLPISEGAYTLRVMGETYEGEGVFDL